MGSSYSGDHITGDHIHTNLTTCNTEKPQKLKGLKRLESIFDNSFQELLGDVCFDGCVFVNLCET